MKFICEYGIPNKNEENRYYALSCNDKFSYIVSSLSRENVNIEIISPTHTLNKKGWYKKRTDTFDSGMVISGPTFGASSRLSKIIQKLFSLLWLFLYLLKNCEKNEIVCAYHLVRFSPVLSAIVKLKKINLVLEVEELFYELGGFEHDAWRTKTEKKLIESATAYIFASNQLEKKCNYLGKPYVIANGKYSVPEVHACPLEDGKIHLVYAGLIEDGKVAFRAIRIARYLPENYMIHIIGYGKATDIDKLVQDIKRINEVSCCKVVFDGTKRGKEYEEYLQKCSIGLCPLVSDVRFQLACFPSKILSYLSNGLCVVTTQNEVIESSPYKDYITLSENETPEAFAEAILSMKGVDATSNPRRLIEKMDKQFCEEINQLIALIGEMK